MKYSRGLRVLSDSRAFGGTLAFDLLFLLAELENSAFMRGVLHIRGFPETHEGGSVETGDFADEHGIFVKRAQAETLNIAALYASRQSKGPIAPIRAYNLAG